MSGTSDKIKGRVKEAVGALTDDQSRRHRQGRDLPEQAGEQTPCEVALRQEQPVVAGVLYQTPPVFTNRCCKLVSDQLPIPWGSASRRHRLPRV